MMIIFFFNFRKAGKVTAQTEAKKCQIFEVTLNWNLWQDRLLHRNRISEPTLTREYFVGYKVRIIVEQWYKFWNERTYIWIRWDYNCWVVPSKRSLILMNWDTGCVFEFLCRIYGYLFFYCISVGDFFFLDVNWFDDKDGNNYVNISILSLKRQNLGQILFAKFEGSYCCLRDGYPKFKS